MLSADENLVSFWNADAEDLGVYHGVVGEAPSGRKAGACFENPVWLGKS